MTQLASAKHLATIALVCMTSATACTSRASSVADPGSADKYTTLIDLRQAPPARPPTLRNTEETRIVTDVFGANYTGPAVTVNSMAQGYFTSAATPQQVYLLERGGPRAAQPLTSPVVVLALYAGQVLQGRFNIHNGNFIVAATDVNGDGISELLLRRDLYQMGTSDMSLTLVSLLNGDQTQIAHFDGVLKDSCDQQVARRRIDATVIDYTMALAGQWPVFRRQQFESRCKVDGKAR